MKQLTNKNKFISFILEFKKSFKLKKLSFCQQNFNGFEVLLTDLYTEGLISGYKLLNKKKTVEIFIKYNPYGKSLVFLTKIVTKPSQIKYISHKQIKNIKYKEPFTYHIVRTNQQDAQIVLQKRASYLHTGGQYLAQIK